MVKIFPGAFSTLLFVAVAIALLPSADHADAAFPGANGWVAFDSDRDGNGEIYKMNADGTGQTRLTNNTAFDEFPDWQPVLVPPPPVCGNAVVEPPEQCDPPQTNSSLCPQSNYCQAPYLCVRDAYGDCAAYCGCSYDAGSCGCQVGQCDAQCASSADCAPGWMCSGCTCVSGTPAAVGGWAELPEAAKAPASESGSSAPPYALLAGGLAAAVLALTASAWYARRRWFR